VKGILKTWYIWNVKGAMYLYTLPTILEEACVKVNHKGLQKVQQHVKYQFHILRPVLQLCDICYMVDLQLIKMCSLMWQFVVQIQQIFKMFVLFS
jgi:hypothetical protein